MNISAEMSLDKIEIERSAYTFLDLLSDVGGINAILISIFAGFLSIINYNHFDSFMASRLFKLKKEDADTVFYKNYFDRSNFFKPSKLTNILDYLMDSLPQCLVCCKRNRDQEGLRMAIKELDEEIDIIEMIKSRRYFKMALRHLLPERLRMDLKQRSRYIMIDPEKEEKEANKQVVDSIIDQVEYKLN